MQWANVNFWGNSTVSVIVFLRRFRIPSLQLYKSMENWRLYKMLFPLLTISVEEGEGGLSWLSGCVLFDGKEVKHPVCRLKTRAVHEKFVFRINLARDAERWNANRERHVWMCSMCFASSEIFIIWFPISSCYGMSMHHEHDVCVCWGPISYGF